jgi:hypothetical protein
MSDAPKVPPLMCKQINDAKRYVGRALAALETIREHSPDAKESADEAIAYLSDVRDDFEKLRGSNEQLRRCVDYWQAKYEAEV